MCFSLPAHAEAVMHYICNILLAYLQNIAVSNRYVLKASRSKLLQENIFDANNTSFTQKFEQQPD